MENKLIRIDANPVILKASYNYNLKNLVDGVKSLNREISTIEEYYEWVREWKITHALLVHGIQFFRAIKTRYKYDIGFRNTTNDNCDTLQWKKKYFGQFARTLYQLRADQKARLKSGEIKITEAV